MTDPPRLPRIVVVVSAIAVLVAINEAAPRLLPAVLGLVVLYAALTNLPRAQALLGGIDTSLAAIIRPPAATGGGGGRGRRP